MPAYGYTQDDLKTLFATGHDPHDGPPPVPAYDDRGNPTWQTAHICGPLGHGVSGMRDFYHRLGLLPTSTSADTVLIRSHVAYWGGHRLAAEADIRPSRGHSYNVFTAGGRIRTTVRIADHYDHREGVICWK